MTIKRLNKLMLFFFNDTATTEIYTLSLHDALPISAYVRAQHVAKAHALGQRLSAHHAADRPRHEGAGQLRGLDRHRSEEHTSELQSRQYLVCRLLLEKKKTTDILYINSTFACTYTY